MAALTKMQQVGVVAVFRNVVEVGDREDDLHCWKRLTALRDREVVRYIGNIFAGQS